MARGLIRMSLLPICPPSRDIPDILATSFKPVKCWAARPGLDLFARMFLILTGIDTIFDNEQVVRTICPPPSRTLPSIIIMANQSVGLTRQGRYGPLPLLPKSTLEVYQDIFFWTVWESLASGQPLIYLLLWCQHIWYWPEKLLKQLVEGKWLQVPGFPCLGLHIIPLEKYVINELNHCNIHQSILHIMLYVSLRVFCDCGQLWSCFSWNCS